MKVKFLGNLGSQDAKAFGLDHSKCTEGAVADVPDGLVEGIGARYPGLIEPVALKAVPPASDVQSRKGKSE